MFIRWLALTGIQPVGQLIGLELIGLELIGLADWTSRLD